MKKPSSLSVCFTMLCSDPRPGKLKGKNALLLCDKNCMCMVCGNESTEQGAENVVSLDRVPQPSSRALASPGPGSDESIVNTVSR